MNKYKIILFLLFSFICTQALNFDEIPIQEEGRIKPLDSFARNQLLALYGKSELTITKKITKLDSNQNQTSYDTTYKESAVQWLFRVLNQDPDVFNELIFKIENPDVATMLNINIHKKSIYSFNSINEGLLANQSLLFQIQNTENDNRTLIEKQLWDLWVKRSIFLDLSNSAISLLPMIKIEHPEIAEAFKIEIGQFISYSYYVRNKEAIHNNLTILSTQPSFSKNDRLLFELNEIIETLNLIEHTQSSFLNNDLLKLLPNNKSEVWISPNLLIFQINNTQNSLNPIQIQMLSELEFYFNPNNLEKDKNLNLYNDELVEKIENKTNINANLLIREVNYNKSNLLFWSLIFYIITLVALTIISMTNIKKNIYRLIPLILIVIGFLYHLSGVIIRMTILKRPPVSTLYESIIFVGLIAVLFSIILELIKRDHMSLFIGTIAGIILHYLSFGYAADGDTFGVLVAVLNSNFWLSTHVTTITTGYGATLIAGLIGHFYLIKANWNPNNKKQLKIIYNNMLVMTFIALFFTMFGTILGGIWGDQSWGRFWGWDPKENGALLIVMWLLMMIHLRLSGWVKAPGYALGLVLANITVALAWFGVNLLNVGLHSYGFTEGAFFNLFAFIIFEIIFGLTMYGILKLRS